MPYPPVPVSVLQSNIIAEIGDEGGVLAANIASYWAQWDGKASIHPDLQGLYTKRSLIRLLQSTYRTKADLQQMGGVAIKASQLYGNLADMLKETAAEIVRIEQRANRSRVPATGTIAATTVSVPPDSPNAPAPSIYIDANDPAYRGDPYRDPALGSGEVTQAWP